MKILKSIRPLLLVACAASLQARSILPKPEMIDRVEVVDGVRISAHFVRPFFAGRMAWVTVAVKNESRRVVTLPARSDENGLAFHLVGSDGVQLLDGRAWPRIANRPMLLLPGQEISWKIDLADRPLVPLLYRAHFAGQYQGIFDARLAGLAWVDLYLAETVGGTTTNLEPIRIELGRDRVRAAQFGQLYADLD